MRQVRRPSILFSIIAGSLLAACSTELSVETTGVGGGAGEGGAGGSIEVTCSSQPGDHTAACPSARGCPIVVDREIVCTDPQFAKLGQRALTTPEASYVSVTAWDFTALFEVSADDARELEAFPLDPDVGRIALAVDATGTLAAVTDETQGNDYQGGLSFTSMSGDQFSDESVFDQTDRYVPFSDFAFDRDGVAHVWYSSNPPAERSVARRAANGSWSHEVATSPGVDWFRFAIGTDNQPVAFGFAEASGVGNSWQLFARVGSEERALGSAVDGSGPLRYRPLGMPMPPPVALGIAYGAVIQHEENLVFAWPTDTGYLETIVAGTALPSYTCALGFDFETEPPCPGPCHEQASGLAYEAFAAVLGADGQVWLAYVETHFDTMIGYEVQDIDGMDVCVGNITSDSSRSELHLVRLRSDAAEELLTLPLEALDRDDTSSSEATDAQAVSLHAFGDELTIGVRVLEESGQPKVRVLRIDASAFGN